MIGSQTTRPWCSHLKLDDVATPACPFFLVSFALYASVYACVSLCAQTDRPPTECGNATSWEKKWTTGRGRVRGIKHVWRTWPTLPHVMSVNHTLDNKWSMPEQLNASPNAVMTSHKQRPAIHLKWYRSSGQFLTLFLWRCRHIYTSCMGSAK